MAPVRSGIPSKVFHIYRENDSRNSLSSSHTLLYVCNCCLCKCLSADNIFKSLCEFPFCPAYHLTHTFLIVLQSQSLFSYQVYYFFAHLYNIYIISLLYQIVILITLISCMHFQAKYYPGRIFLTAEIPAPGKHSVYQNFNPVFSQMRLPWNNHVQ